MLEFLAILKNYHNKYLKGKGYLICPVLTKLRVLYCRH